MGDGVDTLRPTADDGEACFGQGPGKPGRRLAAVLIRQTRSDDGHTLVRIGQSAFHIKGQGRFPDFAQQRRIGLVFQGDEADAEAAAGFLQPGRQVPVPHLQEPFHRAGGQEPRCPEGPF